MQIKWQVYKRVEKSADNILIAADEQFNQEDEAMRYAQSLIRTTQDWLGVSVNKQKVGINQLESGEHIEFKDLEGAVYENGRWIKFLWPVSDAEKPSLLEEDYVRNRVIAILDDLAIEKDPREVQRWNHFLMLWKKASLTG